MIDMPRQKMYDHKDSVWLFDVCGIDPGSLFFADEVELSTLVEAGRMKMSVIGQDVLMTRNEVGSVCTILMEMLLAGHRCLLQPPYMKAFILAGILLDTENLDFGSRNAEDDARVSKLISQYYDRQPSGQSTPYIELAQSKLRLEADHEYSDRESMFTLSQEQTSTSEAGTNSILEGDSHRPKIKEWSSFKYSILNPHSVPARSHHLSLSGRYFDQASQAVAHTS